MGLIQVTAEKKVNSIRELFKEWVKITISYSKLTPKEADFLSVLLTKKYELSLLIKDDKYLTKILFDKESKEEMKDVLGMKNIQIWENMATELRKKKVILENNKINSTFAPVLKKDEELDKLVVTFKINLNDKG